MIKKVNLQLDQHNITNHQTIKIISINKTHKMIKTHLIIHKNLTLIKIINNSSLNLIYNSKI
jgi:hypothetical protein